MGEQRVRRRQTFWTDLDLLGLYRLGGDDAGDL
jgi:hypothetical protein